MTVLFMLLGSHPVAAIELPKVNNISVSYKFEPLDTFERQLDDVIQNSRFDPFTSLTIGMYLDLNRADSYAIVGTRFLSYRSLSLDIGIASITPIPVVVGKLDILSILIPSLYNNSLGTGIGVIKNFDDGSLAPIGYVSVNKRFGGK